MAREAGDELLADDAGGAEDADFEVRSCEPREKL